MIIFYLIAFLGGTLSLFSPCSGALLPMYLAMSFGQKSRLIFATLIFSIGVLIVSIPIGIGFTLLANFLFSYGQVIFRVWAFVLLLAGIFSILGINPLSNLSRSSQSGNPAGLKHVFVIGIFSGLSLGTCTGPVIGAIATLSTLTGSVSQALILMLFYTMGIITPLFIIAFGFGRLNFLQKFLVRGKVFCQFNIGKTHIHIHSTNVLIGLFFIFIAYLFYFNGGSIGGISSLSSTDGNLFIYRIQDALVKIMFKSR